MKTFITTDTHFSHKKLTEWGRPQDFEKRILEGLATAIRGVNSAEEVMVIHLGDVSIGNDAENMIRFVEATRSCYRVLVKGNHDNRSDNWYIEHGFDFVCETFTNTCRGKKIVFSHYPQGKAVGIDFNLHGHCHGSAHRDADKPFDYDPHYHIDCAPDTHDYKPILLEKFLE